MKYAVLAAFMLAVLAGQARAQGLNMEIPVDNREMTEEQKKQDRAYQATIKAGATAKSVDPWGNLRNVETGSPQSQPKPVARSRKPN